MENEFSKVFFDSYLSSNNSLIEVTLKNGRKVNGVFISFVFGDLNKNEPFIKTWHIVEEKYKSTLGINAFGFRMGELISQKDIMSIKYLEDKLEF